MTRLKGLYVQMRKVGHPVLWVGLVAALYGNLHYRERLYQETPSIPFRPVCAPQDDWSPIRPIEGVTMSPAYIRAAIMAIYDTSGIYIKSVKNNAVRIQKEEFPPTPDGTPNPLYSEHPILITPEMWEEHNFMLSVTNRAYIVSHKMQSTPGIGPAGEIFATGPYFTKICEEIEGKFTEF